MQKRITMKKELYEAPTSKVMDVKTQGMLCQSGSGSLFLLDPSDYANGDDPFANQ